MVRRLKASNATGVARARADRKFKRSFGAAPPHPGLVRATPRAAAARRSSASEATRGAAHVSWCWTGVSGWGRVAPQGCPGGTAAGRAPWVGLEDAIANGIAHAQRGETPRRCAHVVPESTRDGWA